MHRVEVSDEVWERLAELAIPFEDHTPDDVLRRVLLGPSRTPTGGPKGLSYGGSDASPKERGKRARQEYVDRLRREGIDVRLAERLWAYIEKNDTWLAIPFATEQRPNRWFLGMPEWDSSEKARVSVILLCEDSDHVFGVFLSPDVLQRIKGKISRSKDQKQLKFNLVRTGKRYELRIPRSGRLPVSDYVDAWPLLNN